MIYADFWKKLDFLEQPYRPLKNFKYIVKFFLMSFNLVINKFKFSKTVTVVEDILKI